MMQKGAEKGKIHDGLVQELEVILKIVESEKESLRRGPRTVRVAVKGSKVKVRVANQNGTN